MKTKGITVIIIFVLVFAVSVAGFIVTFRLMNPKISETVELELSVLGVKTTPMEDGGFVQLMVAEYDTEFRNPQFSEEVLDLNAVDELQKGDRISLRINSRSADSLNRLWEVEFVELKTPTKTVLSFDQYCECQRTGWFPMQIFTAALGGISGFLVIWMIYRRKKMKSA